MTNPRFSLQQDYWTQFTLQNDDLEFLYNHMLEIETPQTPIELVRALVDNRIKNEKKNLEKKQAAQGKIYLPKESYQPDEKIVLPQFDWREGRVLSVREGVNPDSAPFQVIEVELDDHTVTQLAANFSEHALNNPTSTVSQDENLDVDEVIKSHGKSLLSSLNAELESNPDLVRIAGRWFPRSLLVDVNIGYLNLAEALLDMEEGGPMSTQAILEQIELPTDVNLKLTEFSLNLSLEEDGRFDEVGPSGEVLWYLRRLEPEGVQNPPSFLRYQSHQTVDTGLVAPLLSMFEGHIEDDLEDNMCREGQPDQDIAISLIFPHWRAGTLPLCEENMHIFPTAIESPRVLFTFVDAITGERFPGWVVRQHRYIFGLEKWYASQELMPGSVITLKKGQKPGEVSIHSGKRRPTREWVRTALIGADGGIVFAMLKQLVASQLDERMAFGIPDVKPFDEIWNASNKQRGSLEQTVISMMRELAKLTPQGHVHAQELYAAVNIVRRCPPGPILQMLVTQPWASHLGDLYFRLDDKPQEG